MAESSTKKAKAEEHVS